MIRLSAFIICLLTVLSLQAQKYDIDIDFDCFVATVKMPDHVIEATVWNDEDKRIKVEDEKWYSWYQSNMIVTTQSGYNGKLLHGKYQETYLDKHIKKQGTYHFGLKDGTWKEWYTDGTLRSVYEWNKGMLEGNFTEYSANGQVITKGSYKNGLLNGKYLEYNNGEISGERMMKNGEEVIAEPKKQKKKKDSKPKKVKDKKSEEDLSDSEEIPEGKPRKKDKNKEPKL